MTPLVCQVQLSFNNFSARVLCVDGSLPFTLTPSAETA